VNNSEGPQRPLALFEVFAFARFSRFWGVLQIDRRRRS
jgi:hypothetical protein